MGRIRAFKDFLSYNSRKLDELLWAEVFHDSIKGINWIEKELFPLNPGRWAVGYNWLYAAFRMLNDNEPSKVLEFGLGQSTVMINQYFKHCEKMSDGGVKRHLVVEQDAQWGDIFMKNHNTSEAFQLSICNLSRNDMNSFYNSKQLRSSISNDKFGFISIDGPNDGGVIKDGSARNDILNYIPELLDEDFCIILDDVNNPRKMQTSLYVEKSLRKHGISCCSSVYRGQTDIKVIASESLKYMTTL